MANTTASERVPLAPWGHAGDLDARSQRARSERMAVAPLGGGLYRVESQSDHVYHVDLPGGRCTCPDHMFRTVRCKHIRRVAMEITEGRVPPPGELPFECAACGATVFADERSPPEKLHLCPNCAFEPGDLAVDRETGDLLVVARVTDRRADAVEIPGRDCTVAAYPKNERYDPSDPVVEVMYPIPAGLESDDLKPHHLRRYSFPHGRLERHRPARVDGGGGGADGNRDDQRRLNEFAAV